MRFSSTTGLQVGEHLRILPKLNLEVAEFEAPYKTSEAGMWSLWFKYNTYIAKAFTNTLY